MGNYGSNFNYGESPIYKDLGIGGHIGAFYFGPFSTSIIADSMEYSATLLQPTVIAQTNISASVITPLPMEINYQLLNPSSVVGTVDINIDFVGIPRIGVSPLTVDFEANITFGGDYQDKYYVSEYHWYFDYENNPSVYVTSTIPNITNIYTGYAGQYYDVRLCIVIGVK
jgi:hypothetical protein